jgi:hypothetical protein
MIVVICRNAPALSSPFPLQQILELQMHDDDDVLTSVGRVWNFSPNLGQVSAGSLTQKNPRSTIRRDIGDDTHSSGYQFGGNQFL